MRKKGKYFNNGKYYWDSDIPGEQGIVFPLVIPSSTSAVVQGVGKVKSLSPTPPRRVHHGPSDRTVIWEGRSVPIRHKELLSFMCQV